MNSFDYILPAWSLSMIINGDASGITDAEEVEVVTFEARVFTEHGAGHWATDGEQYFRTSNDITNLGDDVVDAKYFSDEEKEIE